MNKADLVESITKETGSTKAAAGDFIDAFIKSVSGALAKGDTVQFIGFGSLSVTKTKARLGRNPRTGEALKIPAAKRVRFAVGAKLKAAVNKSKK